MNDEFEEEVTPPGVPFLKQNTAFENFTECIQGICEKQFDLRARKTTLSGEVYVGVIMFVSCMYCLAVVPAQLAKVDSQDEVVAAIAVCSGIGSILMGLVTNTPLVVAPPTSIAIYFANASRKLSLSAVHSSNAVCFSGIILLLIFIYEPVGKFISRLIPVSIQVGTTIGIGLITSLSGASSVNLVVTGSDTLLEMGELTPKIFITITGIHLYTIVYTIVYTLYIHLYTIIYTIL